jgi:hypothetical protein
MAQKNRVFTKEFKLEAVRRMQAGESAAGAGARVERAQQAALLVEKARG